MDAQLLGARLCHDLLGPLSAIRMGLETCEDGINAQYQDIFKHIQMSVDKISARLVLLRLLYTNPEFKPFCSAEEIQQLFTQFLSHDKVGFNLKAPPQITLQEVGILVLLVLTLTGQLAPNTMLEIEWQPHKRSVLAHTRFPVDKLNENFWFKTLQELCVTLRLECVPTMDAQHVTFMFNSPSTEIRSAL